MHNSYRFTFYFKADSLHLKGHFAKVPGSGNSNIYKINIFIEDLSPIRHVSFIPKIFCSSTNLCPLHIVCEFFANYAYSHSIHPLFLGFPISPPELGIPLQCNIWNAVTFSPLQMTK